MEIPYTVIVAHPYKQHSYQTALAFQEQGSLNCYITTIYKKSHSPLSFLYKVIPRSIRKKIDNYHSDLLDQSKVVQICRVSALVALVLALLPGASYFSEMATSMMLKRFNRKLVKIVLATRPNAIITYDTLSGDVLEALVEKKFFITKIVDMSAPFLCEMKKIFNEKLQELPDQLRELNGKFKSRTYFEKNVRAIKELEYADFFICASEFTKNTLVHNGIDPVKVSVCRYGNKSAYEKVSVNDRKNDTKRRLSGIYIGNVSYSKGVQYIVEAISNSTDFIELFTYIGAIQNSSIKSIANNKIEYFTGYITHKEVLKYCQKADFSVFPSLADGFGFAVVESMSAGLPVICSENAGASDLIKDGVNGFIVKAGNAKQISDKIKWIYENPDAFELMGREAIDTVKHLTFEKYYDDIKSVIFKAQESTSVSKTSTTDR